MTSLTEKTSNPSVKEEATNLLGRALQHYHSAAPQAGLPARRNLVKRLLAHVAPLMEARTDGLREAAYTAMAASRIYLADEPSYARLTASAVDDSKKSRIDQVFARLTAQPVKRPREAPDPEGRLLLNV